MEQNQRLWAFTDQGATLWVAVLQKISELEKANKILLDCIVQQSKRLNIVEQSRALRYPINTKTTVLQ